MNIDEKNKNNRCDLPCNTQDRCVGLSGPRGFRGQLGPRGIDGATGATGATGDTGAQGPMGSASAVAATSVYVNSAVVGPGTGTYTDPFKNIHEGIALVTVGGYSLY